MGDVRARRATKAPSLTAPGHSEPDVPFAHELQQLIGNSATASLAGVQRDEDTDAPAPEPATLTNPRFVGDRSLARILSGDIDQLSARHNGRNRAVGRVQRALVDLGFDLPLHRVDGRFGGETTTAIAEFRARYGPSPGDVLDSATLELLDRVTPASTEERLEHTVEYERLLDDNRLDVTVAFGFSDYNALRSDGPNAPIDTGEAAEEVAAERFRDWLTGRGFELELLMSDNEQWWKAEHNFVWTSSEGTAHSRTADIWVRLITPGTGAAEAFGRGISQDELTIYSGHARYGSGPDFDGRTSPDENFRIGIDTALREAGRQTSVERAIREGIAPGAVNDLVELTSSPDFDHDRYRVLFMKACTSMAYLDEIRSEIGGGDNTDVVGTRRPTTFSINEAKISPAEVQIFLGGVLDGETIEDIIDALDRNQRVVYGNRDRRGVFTMSGVGDNPVSR